MSFESLVTFLRTRDLERAHRYYADELGLPMVLDQGRCRIYRISVGGYLGFCLGEPNPDGVIVTLVAPDVEKRCAALEASGVRFESPLAYNAEFDITHAFLRDPDGHLVEIQRFESWPG
jgi:catechol 2,3-dioxygenase-like lactoylglutathione lyase family enzyme